MGFGTSIIIGIILGIIAGAIPNILQLIPFFGITFTACNCIISPLLVVIFGYLVGSIGKIKAGSWGDLAVQNGVFALTAAIVGTAVNTLLTLLNIGTTVIGGRQDIIGMGLVAATGLAGIIIMFLMALIFNLVLGFIGGVIYMFTGAKK